MATDIFGDMTRGTGLSKPLLHLPIQDGFERLYRDTDGGYWLQERIAKRSTFISFTESEARVWLNDRCGSSPHGGGRMAKRIFGGDNRPCSG